MIIENNKLRNIQVNITNTYKINHTKKHNQYTTLVNKQEMKKIVQGTQGVYHVGPFMLKKIRLTIHYHTHRHLNCHFEQNSEKYKDSN